MPNSETASQQSCGFVALIGAPNAGKSTLVNALVGAKVSIVSCKVQTTRSLVRGICMEGETQLVLVDTPGLFAPKRRLERAMVTSAWGGAGDADVICLLIDVRKWPDEESEAILERLPDLKQKKFLVLNKIDMVPPEEREARVRDFVRRYRWKGPVFAVSALAREGLQPLLHQAFAHVASQRVAVPVRDTRFDAGEDDA